jgi:glycosyltransferase involved in cell wall biosynthesis
VRVLHVAAHLGGGVGKAHAAINRVMPDEVVQTYAVVGEVFDWDRRHVDAIKKRSRVVLARSAQDVVDLAEGVEVVQYEYWGHPALDRVVELARLPSRVKTVCWSHVSGLNPPLVPVELIKMVDQFVLTSKISLGLFPGYPVVESGFGVERQVPRLLDADRVLYLGTMDFKKMHRDIFSAIDRMTRDVRVYFWGRPGEGVTEARGDMNHPGRAVFKGRTDDPSAVLAGAGVFFYLLRPDHYGTGENALVEAMSSGLVPIVMDNPAERSIVTHGTSGMTARTVDEAADHLAAVLTTPSERRRLSVGAMRAVLGKTPEKSAKKLVKMWQELLC